MIKLLNSVRQGAIYASRAMKKRVSVFSAWFVESSKRMYTMLCRAFCKVVSHRETLGYYAVLTLVLVALGAAANDYRTRRLENRIGQALALPEAGVVVQTRTDPTLEPDALRAEYIMPVNGNVIRGFSDSELTWSTTLQLWQTHPAVDIAATPGEAVVAAAKGTVTEAYSDSLYGNIIVVQNDDGSMLRYCCLNTLELVEIGKSVRQGETISSAGVCSAEAELGCHVHLEYYAGGEAKDFMLLFE